MGSVYPSPDTTRRLSYCRVAQECIAVAEVTAKRILQCYVAEPPS